MEITPTSPSEGIEICGGQKMILGNTIYFKSVEGGEGQIVGENGQTYIPQFSIQIDADEAPTITHGKSKNGEEIAYISTQQGYIRIDFIKSVPLIDGSAASLSNPLPLKEFPQGKNQKDFLKNLWVQEGERRRAVLKFAREIANIFN